MSEQPALNWWTVPEALAFLLPDSRTTIEEHLLGYWDFNVRPYPHEFLESYLLPVLRAPQTPPDQFRRAVMFLAELLTHEDTDLAEATYRSVIDPLANDTDSVQRVCDVHPPDLQRAVHDAVAWFRLHPGS